MTCSNEEWLTNFRSIGLMVYSIVATLMVLSTVVIKLLNNMRIKKRHSAVEIKPEDLQHLNRKSIDNKYEIDSCPRQIRSPQITPNIHRSLSEYDPITSASKHTAEPEDPPIVHHYEEMETKSEHRQYDRIIDHVATALSTVYDSNSKNRDIYEQFMKQLLKKIKAKHLGLYESIQGSGGVSGHMYEEIQEPKQQLVNAEHDLDDDNGYGTYIPPENGKKYVEVKKTKDFSRRRNVFGSTDHLKFLKQSERVKLQNETPYLEAKRFSAKIDCPEELRKLCREQDKLRNGNKVPPNSPTKQTDLIDEYVPSSLAGQSSHRPHKIISKSNSRRSHEFEQKSEKLQRVLSAIGLPKLPLKLSRTQLSRSESLL